MTFYKYILTNIVSHATEWLTQQLACEQFGGQKILANTNMFILKDSLYRGSLYDSDTIAN